MTSSEDPIQAQLAAARRSQILEAATKVFAEKGFHRATIKEIAREAGIADGTIYNYFDSKPDLLIGILDRLNETQQRDPDFSHGMATEMRAFLKAYTRHRLAVLQPNLEVIRAVLPELLVSEELRERYYRQMVRPSLEVAANHFQARIEQGHIRPVDVSLTVRVLAGAVLGLLVLQMMGDDCLETAGERLPETLTTLFFDGLEPQEEKP